MIENRPLPATDNPIDAAFWEGTRRGELRVQKCGGCAKLRFPPRPVCPHCRSFAAAWQAMSGKGRIWSYVVPHPPLLPAFAEKAPYNVILVELDEDPAIRMVGNLVGTESGDIDEIDPHTVEIGTPVRAVFQPVTEDVTMIRWIRTP